MENIDNWEKLTNEQVGVYLSDKRDSINVSQYADGTDTRYQYETGVQNQNPHQYLGKIKHKYQDIHRNPLSTFSRNAWNGLLQLPEGIGEEAINLGELADVKLLRAFGGDEEFEKRLNAGATALRQKLKHWFDTYQFENSERIKENKFVADLGQGTGSLFAALGLTLATKSPNAAAGVFGISQAGNLTSEMRERGVDIDKANQVGILGGAIEGKLEQFGLHLWIENYATKKLGTFLAKQSLVEFTQEASQTAAEETLMRTLGERKDNKTIVDIAKEVIYSGIMGGILGLGGGAVTIPATQAFKSRATNTLVESGMTEEQANSLVNEKIYGTPEQQQELLNIVNEGAKQLQIENAKKKLMELGVKESKAQEMAYDLVVTPQEMGEDLVETLNKEADNDTLLNGSYEDDVKDFIEKEKVDIVAEAFDVKQELKGRFMTEGGVQEDEAEAAATLVENFTRTIYNETGETPREYIERKGLNVLDERYPADEDEVIDESELTEEEIARLDAKEQARMEEEDIPFFQKSENIYYQEGDKDIEKLQQELKDWQEQLEKDKENPYNLNERVVENNIKFDKKEIARIKKQIKELEKSLGEPLSEKLYATHNMSLAGVREALKLGGLAMPSLAMRKVSQGNINQFGDIVFVANERLATPSRTNEVYDRDAWTPSLHYNVRYDLLPEANTFIKQVLEKAGQPLRASVFRYNISENIGSPASNTMAMELYALDKGKEENYNIGNDTNYLDWYDEHFTANTEPYLWTENASNTDMVRKKFTLDNMMKILRKQEKSGGGFIGDFIFDVYKLLNFRSQKFKNLKEIKKNRHKLVSREEAQKGLDKLNEDFLALAEELKKEGEDYSFGDATYGLGLALVQDTDKEIVRWLDYKNLQSDDAAVKKVKDFIERMKDIPTDYFEVKPRRIVNFDEFSGVIIPEGAQYDEVARILEKQHFLNVERVEKGNEEQYEKALQNIQANASTTFFQLSPQEEENFTEMYVSEGKKSVLDWINRQVEYYRNAVDDAVNENAKAYMRQLRDKKIAWLREVEDFINTLDTKGVEIKNERTFDKTKETQAKKYFGTTYNLNEAGYILTDGSLLDFSGKKEGGRAGTRSYDHREISGAFEDRDVDMEDFVNNGAIRYMPETNSLFVANMPTSQQIKAIERIIDKANGEINLELVRDAKYMGAEGSGFYKEFDSGSSIKNIKNAINAYYSGNLSKLQTFFQSNKVKRGSYNPKTRVINLFKEANRSTLIHELGHVFTMDYVKILEESGQTEKLAGFYEWLGINDISEATTETWEKMARGFETYIMEGQAPNVSTQNLFERLRQWLVGVYKDLKGKVIPPEEINDDVREFFDKMLSQDEEMPDITSLKGRTQDILKVIQAAQKGESISVNGLSLEDVKKLVKASRARLPRKPKTLEQDIRAQGGIDIQLAKSLGIYDEKKGNRSGFFKKDGKIKREDSLIEFLQDAGYLEQTETDTYEQTAELQDKAIELIEKADTTYTPENQTIMEQRQTLEAIASEAMAELSEKGIKEKELFTALKTIKSVNLQAVSKDELKYLKSQLKSLEKDYKKFMKNTLRNQRKDFTQKQNEMLDFIKAMPLTGEDKVKLLTRVKKAKFIDDFNRVAREVFNKGRELYENEQKKRYVTLIKKEIRKSKPTGAMKQRYDYENNKLFADLRKWNNLTQAQAQEELAKIEVQDDKTETDLIRIRFLNYKANGMDSSVELMEEVYNDIMNAKEAGRLAKGDIDVAKAVNRELLKRDVLDAIAQNDADKETFKTKFTNLYRRGLTNLYSMLNSISSKGIADRFQMETVVNNAEIRTYKHIEKLTNEILDMLNLKSKGQLLDRLGEMGQIIDNITDTEGRVRELSKLHILDIYNAMKNEKTRGNYIRSYGEEQLARVLRYLTPQDLMLADMLMEDVNTLYPETNKVYIENYGMDLKKVNNYWPATSEHQKEADLLGDVFSQQTIPSFQKERVRGAVTPIPRNAWSKYLKHVKQSIYMINTANKYKELADTFKSSRVKNAIQTKFGDGVYTELMAQIERLSLNGASQDLNYLETAFGAVLNNFVVAKIAVAPTVFVGQLTSITNYSESIKTGQFYKNFAEGLSHPKKTIEYMKKVSGDFLESRYKGGYSEAVSRVLSEAESVNKKKFRVLSTGTKYNVVNALTSWVRMGDIGAIIFGGYAQIKSNLDNGMSLEDAKKKFEFDTLRSQQSSNAASLSSFQQSKGFARMFLAFKNTQHQYLRKIADAIINYQRGEISSQQMGKIILNYAIIQTSLYVIAKNITKAALGLSGDDDDLTDGVIEQILVGSLDAIPILSDLLRYTYKRLTKQYAGGLVNMPGVDDIEKAINKLAKEEKDVYDYVDIISPLIEGTTSLPVQRFKGIVKKYSE